LPDPWKERRCGDADVAASPWPRGRRTRHRHSQDLKDPDQAALLPTPRYRDAQAILVLQHVEASRYSGQKG
jgi:hypothetical protein